MALWAGIYLVYIAIRTKATSIYHAQSPECQLRYLNRWRFFVEGSATTHGAILSSLGVYAAAASVTFAFPRRLCRRRVCCSESRMDGAGHGMQESKTPML
jgi:hypothetical protein